MYPLNEFTKEVTNANILQILPQKIDTANIRNIIVMCDF
jgi:hypothetical protein